MPATIFCTGVILAGGQSKRMGGINKCLLTLGEKTILQYIVENALPQTDHLLLNSNVDDRNFNFSPSSILRDVYDGNRGPLAGIHAGLKWISTNSPNCTWLASFPSDTPAFPHDLVSRLWNHTDSDHQIIVASHEKKLQPLFALWNISLLDELDSHLRNDGNPKVKSWIEAHRYIAVEFQNLTESAFFNINSPADLNAAKEMQVHTDVALGIQ